MKRDACLKMETSESSVELTRKVFRRARRAPEMGEWGREIGDVRISYQGEVVEKTWTAA